MEGDAERNDGSEVVGALANACLCTRMSSVIDTLHAEQWMLPMHALRYILKLWGRLGVAVDGEPCKRSSLYSLFFEAVPWETWMYRGSKFI